MELLQRVSKEEEDSQEEEEKAEILSLDAVYEILTRVPLDSLQRRCRWVCKDWQNLSYELNFRKLHCERTRTISGYFIQTQKNNTYYNTFISNNDLFPSSNIKNIPSPNLDFLPSKDLKIVASSRFGGLLCCVSNGWPIPRYYICKPSTKEWKQILNPKTRYCTQEIAMVVVKSEPLHYKIVRFSRRQGCRAVTNTGCYCEIFDSNANRWKQYLDVVPDSVLVLGLGQSVLIHSTFYWLLRSCESDSSNFAFNIGSESWKMIELPQEIIELRRDCEKQLVEYNGKLGLLCSYEDADDDNEIMEIWVLENYMNKEKIWEKKDLISLENFHQKVGFSTVPLDLYNAGIVLMMNYGEVVWYDYQKNSCSAVVKVFPHGSSITQVFSFQSDLVSWNYLG